MPTLPQLNAPRLLPALLCLASACSSAAEPAAEPRPAPVDEAPPSEAAPPEADAVEADEPAAPARRRVAVTIDDIPFVGRVRDGDSRLAATARILAALRAHSAPATAFVVCRGLGRHRAIVDAWREAGVELANHTQTHRNIDEIETAEWDRDIEQCHEALEAITGAPPRFFRYPYLHRGQSAARHRASLAAVAALGSRVAPVSIDTNDWAIAHPYGTAIAAGETATATELADVFVQHVLDAAEHFDRVARERTGRDDVPHILLLHANSLVADHLGRLLESLRERGFDFISLEDAMADPVYSRADEYVGPLSMGWLCRMAPLETAPCDFDLESEAELRRRYW